MSRAILFSLEKIGADGFTQAKDQNMKFGVPIFFITKEPLSLSELSSILDSDLSPGDETTWNKERLSAIISLLNENINDLVNDLEGEWEVRCPTQSEWIHAKNSEIINCTSGTKEILADAVSSNYRGAMMDGRPRRFEGHGPMQWHTATMEIHPNDDSVHALSSAPMDRDSHGLSLRLVITPIRKKPARIVPKKPIMAQIFDQNCYGQLYLELFLHSQYHG